MRPSVHRLRGASSRLARLLVVVLGVTFTTFAVLEFAPGDPAYAILGDAATPDAVQAVRSELGLDQPVTERFGNWLADAAHGDLGESFRTHQPIVDMIREALPVTLEIVVLTLVVSLLVAIPLGIYSAYRIGGRFDRATAAGCSVLVATPPFVSVPVLVWLFVFVVQVLPASGWVDVTENPVENLRHLILPVASLSATLIPVFVAALRSDMATTLNEDFILSARAKGLKPNYILFRHALRPSAFSLLTLASVNLGRLIGGTVIVEVLFSLPGIGSLTIDAINARDLPVVQGIVAVIAVAYVLINAVTDEIYGHLDPRVQGAAA